MVDLALGHQLVVGALFGDGAVLEHDNAVGVSHRVEPVGDQQRGPALGERLGGALDPLLAFAVDA